MKHQFVVSDMTCGHCVKSITTAIQKQYPAAKVSADVATHWLDVEVDADAQAIMMLLQADGYSPELT